MSSTMPKKKNGFMSVVRETIRVYTVNEMSVYAGYTTLYILMAMVPLLTLVIGVVNLLPDVSLQHVEQVLHDLLPNLPEVHSMLHNIIANVNRQAVSGTGGNYLRQRSAAMLYTLLFIALIPAMFIFRVLRGSIETLINALNEWLNIPDIAGRILNFMEYSGLVTAAAMAIIILLAYTYLQGVRRKLRYQLPGTLFTTLLWLGFSYLFELFIKRFWQASSLYGSLASVFLAAMWLKTIVMILFYGAALNEALIHRALEKRAGN